ncbi:hypothetical protein KL86DES1_10733 [uncultured Desulfovibrio sp.]|uniref:Uncharacterized protein n=1 Tax=uncultured Desulfovibrio sp. TaxID=167968 RepID=A0A212L091_9BACT|nr:hypothetical protein KL86DES1_10733 [uncultured Desulfovibrio sp.]VZH32606.1 conserved protein of unknown function [Desulfovibrio sp. 86]
MLIYCEFLLKYFTKTRSALPEHAAGVTTFEKIVVGFSRPKGRPLSRPAMARMRRNPRAYSDQILASPLPILTAAAC